MLVAYTRSQTVATLLTNYKIQAHEDMVVIGGSHTCGKHLLCHRGEESGIVKKTNFIKFKVVKLILKK